MNSQQPDNNPNRGQHGGSPDKQLNEVQSYLEQTGRRVPDNLLTRSKKTYEVLSKLVASKVAPGKANASNFVRPAPETLPSDAPSAEENTSWKTTLALVGLGIGFLVIVVFAFSLIQKNYEANSDYRQAVDAEKKGNHQLAIKDLDSAEQLGMHDLQLYLLRAQAKAATNDRHAIDDFTLVLNADPTNITALLGRATALLQSKDYESAIADCDSLLKAQPDNAAAISIHARAKIGLGDFEGALADCEKYLSTNPKTVDTDILYTRAFANFKLGKESLAIANLDDLLKQTQDRADAYLLRARCRLKLTLLDKAVDDLSNAIKIDPANAEARVLRADCYTQMNKTKEAIADLDFAIGGGRTPELYTARAGLFAQLKQYERAVDDYDQALSMKPKDVVALRQKRTEAWELLKKTRPAVASLKETLSGSGVPQLHSGGTKSTAQGYALYRAGKYDQAIDALVGVVQKTPNDANARRYLAYSYLSSGASAEAVEQLQALQQMGQSNTTDQMQLARALSAAGRNDRAFEILQNLVNNDPSNHWARLGLIKLYMDSGVNYKAAQLANEGLAQSRTDADRAQYQRLLQGSLAGAQSQ